jgi:hypothetical protein
VVNFFNLSIDTPTYKPNNKNLPRPLYKIFFFQTYLSRSWLNRYGADRPKSHRTPQCMVTFFIPYSTTLIFLVFVKKHPIKYKHISFGPRTCKKKFGTAKNFDLCTPDIDAKKVKLLKYLATLPWPTEIFG